MAERRFILKPAVNLNDSLTESFENYRLISLVLFCAGLFVMSSLYLTIPLVPVFSKVFSVSSELASWTGSAFGFSFAIGSLIYGTLSDKFGRKPVILIGLAGLAIITGLTGFVNDIYLLILCRALQGFAAASFSPVALAYVTDTFPERKRVTAIGTISTGFLMAGTIGQAFASFISEKYGWNFVFYTLGIIQFILFFMVFYLVPNHLEKRKTATISLKQIGTLLGQKNLICAYIISLTLLLSFVGMYSALNDYLSQDPFFLSSQQILYLRIAGISGMLLSPLSGKLVSKLGTMLVIRSGLFLSILGLLGIGSGRHLFLIVPSSIIFVAGLSIVIPTNINFIGQLGGNLRELAVSIYTFILFVGASIAPILVSKSLKSFSHSASFLLLTLCLTGALLISFFISRKSSK